MANHTVDLEVWSPKPPIVLAEGNGFRLLIEGITDDELMRMISESQVEARIRAIQEKEKLNGTGTMSSVRSYPRGS